MATLFTILLAHSRDVVYTFCYTKRSLCAMQMQIRFARKYHLILLGAEEALSFNSTDNAAARTDTVLAATRTYITFYVKTKVFL